MRKNMAHTLVNLNDKQVKNGRDIGRAIWLLPQPFLMLQTGYFRLEGNGNK